MSGVNQSWATRGNPTTRASAAVAALLLCLMLFPALAVAKSFEQVGTFGGVIVAGEVSEEAQLKGVSGLAVNYSGAGGVPKGTVYAVIHEGGVNGNHVARFTPQGGSLKFVERWDLRSPNEEKEREEKGQAPYDICGPAVEDPSESLTGSPHCEVFKEEPAKSGLGIAVDQTTGIVYVGDDPNLYSVGTPLIHLYTPNASKVLTRFGEKGPSPDAGPLEAATPNQIHSSTEPGWLAVNEDGEVFVSDLQPSNNFYHRLMVFKPKIPGNYSEYVYAGESADIGAGFLNETNYLEQPVVDDAGYVYVKNDQDIEKYDPAAPAAPICTFSYAKGAISALTVNPETGEPFFYSFQRPRRIRELSACENGSFQLTGEAEVTPERSELFALAFDPVRQLSAARQPGVLYGGAPTAAPITGKGQPGTSGLGYIFAQPEERPAAISEVAPVNVTVSSATLSALVDPSGFVTDYVFRYLSEADYQAQGETFTGAAEAPVGGASLSPAGGIQRIEATVSGLQADTSYVFQVIASSACSPAEPTKVCPVESPAVELHTYPVEAAGLADGRAYEMVSPVDKGGGQVLPGDPRQGSCAVSCKPGLGGETFPLQSTPDGSAVVYEGEPFGPDGALIENEYLREGPQPDGRRPPSHPVPSRTVMATGIRRLIPPYPLECWRRVPPT